MLSLVFTGIFACPYTLGAGDRSAVVFVLTILGLLLILLFLNSFYAKSGALLGCDKNQAVKKAYYYLIPNHYYLFSLLLYCFLPLVFFFFLFGPPFAGKKRAISFYITV